MTEEFGRNDRGVLTHNCHAEFISVSLISCIKLEIPKQVRNDRCVWNDRERSFVFRGHHVTIDLGYEEMRLAFGFA